MKSIFWSQLIIGLWILISPWVLGYSFVTPALWSSVISGLLIAISSLWGLFGEEEQS